MTNEEIIKKLSEYFYVNSDGDVCFSFLEDTPIDDEIAEAFKPFIECRIFLLNHS